MRFAALGRTHVLLDSIVKAHLADLEPKYCNFVPDFGPNRQRLLEAGQVAVLRRQQRGPVPAYEVWRYFERVPRYYLFVDRPNGASYALVRSNDPSEPKERRWQELLTPTGVKEVVAFLGREVLAQ